MVGAELPSPSTEESTVTDDGARGARTCGSRTSRGGRCSPTSSFTIHNGEVLGIAGVEGNGQTELVEAVVGMRRPPTGTVILDGTDVTGVGHPTTAARPASGYIPEDRQRHGLLLDSPLWENRILGHQTRPPSVNGSGSTARGARDDSERIVESTTSGRPASTRPRGRCPAATSRSSSSAAR